MGSHCSPGARPAEGIFLAGLFWREQLGDGVAAGPGQGGGPQQPPSRIPAPRGGMLEPWLSAGSLPAGEDVSQAWSRPGRILPPEQSPLWDGDGDGVGVGDFPASAGVPCAGHAAAPAPGPARLPPHLKPHGPVELRGCHQHPGLVEDRLSSAEARKGAEETFGQGKRRGRRLTWLQVCRGELFTGGKTGTTS